MSIKAKLVGVGSYLPEKVVTNAMLEDILDTTDQWIKKRTGIHERRVVTDETTTYMAIEASKAALENANVEPNDLDIIVGSTVTGDLATPSIASLVQKGIGCDNVAAMDVAAGCTGFIYAVSTAVALMDATQKDTALVVASENLSSRADWTDRGTSILFGDGAGAVVIKRSDKDMIHTPVLHAIPDTDDVLSIPNVRVNHPWTLSIANDDCLLKMDGKKVFAFAVDAVDKTLRELQEKSSKPITKIIPHQANNRIIRFVAQSSDFEKEQFFVNVDKFANTSSATIPIAMAQAYHENWLEKGDVVALVGFGAGLSYGGIIIEWDLENK